MGCRKKRYCLECKSEVAKVVVPESKTRLVDHARNWGCKGDPEIVSLPLKKMRYDPRNRCYFHLKKFLAKKALRSEMNRRERERR
jgi:hypothetical protein